MNHHPDARAAKVAAVHHGGLSWREKRRRVVWQEQGGPVVPPPPLDWSTPAKLLAWCQQRAAMVEKGQLDRRLVPEELAKLARAIHELEQLAELKDALLRLERGGPTAALIVQLRGGDGARRPFPWKLPRLAAGVPTEEGA